LPDVSQGKDELLVERTKVGLEAACQQGRKGGRKRKMTDSKLKSAKQLLLSGWRLGRSPEI